MDTLLILTHRLLQPHQIAIAVAWAQALRFECARRSGVRHVRGHHVFIGKSGWAVGADNAILCTSDNGKNWVPQRSGNQASYTLTGVAFLTEKIGWATGYRYRDSDLLAVILHTKDGEITWRSQTESIDDGRNFLPPLIALILPRRKIELIERFLYFGR